jgi:hypothetical protein
VTIRRRQIAVLACAAALAASGCGSSNDNEGPGVPAATVDEIDKQLDSLTKRIDVEIAPACVDAQEENIPEIQRQVSRLPDDTDSDIRSALSDSVDNLSSLLDERCQEIADKNARERQETETETTPTETETIPTETTQEPEKQKKEKQPKEQDNGGGNSEDQQDSGGASPE